MQFFESGNNNSQLAIFIPFLTFFCSIFIFLRSYLVTMETFYEKNLWNLVGVLNRKMDYVCSWSVRR